MTKEQEKIATIIINILKKYPNPAPLKLYLKEEEKKYKGAEQWQFGFGCDFVLVELLAEGYIKKTTVPDRTEYEYYRLTKKGRNFKSFRIEGFNDWWKRHPIFYEVLKWATIAALGYAIRVATEPRNNQKESRPSISNTKDSLAKKK